MKNVILYEHPESALCARCKNGEMHTQQTDDALTELDEYESICFFNSANNNGTSCIDFRKDESRKQQYSYLDDFDGYFDVPETEKEEE